MFLAFIIIALNSCNYEQGEKFAIVTGIIEDGTKIVRLFRHLLYQALSQVVD